MPYILQGVKQILHVYAKIMIDPLVVPQHARERLAIQYWTGPF